MALPARKSYKGAPTSTTLSSGISNSATSFAVAAVTGWPTTFPFYAVIDAGTSKEEKVKVTGITSTTLTVVRGQDDTTAVAHDAAAAIYPVFTALEADEANQIASVMTTKGDIITTDGTSINRLAVGATNTHVLQVDSTATNGIKWGQVATAGIADSAVTSAKIADGTIVDADINASAAIALSKLATGALPTAITVASANIVDGTIVAGDLASSLLKLVCPVGTIAPYPGASAPTGWLLCNGGAISGTYTELIALVGANAPDLRGKVLVGKGSAPFDGSLLTSFGSTTSTAPHTHDIDHNHASATTSSGGSHSHKIDGVLQNVINASDSSGYILNVFDADNFDTSTNGSHDHTLDLPALGTTASGASSASATHGNVQPSTIINYIIKHDYV